MPCNVILYLGLFITQVAGTDYFVGGALTWRPTGLNNTVEVSYRLSVNNRHCTDALIHSGSPVVFGGIFECFNGCQNPTTSGHTGTALGVSSDIYCTDSVTWYSWSSGRNTFTYTFPSEQDYFEFGYTGIYWWTGISTNGSGYDVMMRVKANLTVRADTGKINTSPTVDYFPVVMLQYGKHHILRLPVYDADGDVVKCRWAESSGHECGDACTRLPNATLDADNCTISYWANTTDEFAVALQVEDYNSGISPHPLSSVPVQFVVWVQQALPSPPITSGDIHFLPSTPNDNDRVLVDPGNTWTAQIAVVTNNSDPIYLATQSPLGMAKTRFVHDPHASEYSANVTWSRAVGDVRDHVFCFSVVFRIYENVYWVGYEDRRCVLFPGKTSAQITRPSGPVCFACDNMSRGSTCESVKRCAQNEACFLVKYQSSTGDTRLRSGCQPKTGCHQFPQGCPVCCHTDLCNDRGCGETGLPAAGLRGPVCYNCSSVSSSDACHSVALCNANEVCSIEKFKMADNYQYNLGCQNKLQCGSSLTRRVSRGQGRRVSPECRQCCSSDVCNVQCIGTPANPSSQFIG